MEKQKPVYERRLGAVRVAIWENNTDGRAWHSVSVGRRFKHKGEWRDSSTFAGLADLLLVEQAVASAKKWLGEREDVYANNAEEGQLR